MATKLILCSENMYSSFGIGVPHYNSKWSKPKLAPFITNISSTTIQCLAEYREVACVSTEMVSDFRSSRDILKDTTRSKVIL